MWSISRPAWQLDLLMSGEAPSSSYLLQTFTTTSTSLSQQLIEAESLVSTWSTDWNLFLQQLFFIEVLSEREVHSVRNTIRFFKGKIGPTMIRWNFPKQHLKNIPAASYQLIFIIGVVIGMSSMTLPPSPPSPLSPLPILVLYFSSRCNDTEDSLESLCNNQLEIWRDYWRSDF